VQTPAPSEEVLDLNVSSSEDDDDNPSAAQPVPTNAQPVTPMDIGINDANVHQENPKNA
jgi:hypothetical protein